MRGGVDCGVDRLETRESFVAQVERRRSGGASGGVGGKEKVAQCGEKTATS
jgi:hypothetical protein